MPYPTGTDLANWMVAQGLLNAVPGDMTALDAAIAAAITGFEADTYWTPTLASATDETRKFDGPGGYRLFLGGGLLSVTTLKVGGTEMTEDTDFYLLDPKLGKYGFQTIEFNAHVFWGRRIIEIEGRFGLFLEVPADVLLALYSKAAVGLSTDSTSTGAIKREKAGPVEYEYDVSAGVKAKSSQLESSYSSAVSRYRRMA